MNSVLLFFSILSSNIVFSQTLSRESQNLKIAYEQLKNDPGSKSKQLAYLNAFPRNKQQFMEVLQPADFGQLYPVSDQYINTFGELAKYYPNKVIDRSIIIGKDLHWEADATGQMQNLIVQLGSQNVNFFSKELNALSTVNAARLITFLADVENHKAYPEYQRLIEALQRIGQNKLAAKFINTRALREKDHHH